MNDYPKELITENLKRKQKKNKEVTESENERHSTTKIIDKEKAGKIICYLKKIIDTESAQYDANFRSWVQNSEFNLQVINGTEVLHKRTKARVNSNKENNDRTRTELNNKGNLPVAIKEEFFNVIYSIHAIQKAHPGIGNTFNQVNNRYYGIPKTVIWNYVRLCFICNLKLKQQSQSRIHPIISEKFLARFQLDLVDMRHNPSEFCSNQYLLKSKKNNGTLNTYKNGLAVNSCNSLMAAKSTDVPLRS